MKSLLSFLVALFLSASAFSQVEAEGPTTGTIDEATPFYIEFTHATRYSAILYRDALPLKTYPISEVIPVVGTTNLFRILVAGQPKGPKPIEFVLTVIDAEKLESGYSAPLTATVRPRPPHTLKAVPTVVTTRAAAAAAVKK